MILFCDTSALIKLYVREDGSDALLGQASQASAIAVCRIAWTEAHAAFARRIREVASDAAVMDAARDRLRQQWGAFMTVEVTQPLVERAADYADTFALRGYDSVQLAAAALLHQRQTDRVRFACFDVRLRKAGAVLGLLVD